MNWYRANIPPFDQINATHYWPLTNPKTTVPSLLIWGEADQTFVSGFIANMPEYAEDLSVVTLPKTNHWATMENPEMSTQAIVKFLNNIKQKRQRERK